MRALDCFLGHELYETMYQYDRIIRQYEETMSFVRLYVTDVHLRQNYIHYKRAEECFERLISLESQMIHFIDMFQNVCLVFYTPDIGAEWLQTYFMRIFKEVQQRTYFLERNLRTQKVWPQRPLPSNTSRIVVQRRNLSPSNVVPSA